MSNSQTIKLLFLLSFVMVLFACTKRDKNPNPEDDNAQKVYEYIKRLGFPESSIVDAGNKFFVQNDMVFSKKMTVPAPAVRSANTEQYYSSPLVTIANSVIQYKIHSSVSSLTTEITGAIGMWNASGAYVVLQLVSSGEDVLITADDLPPNVCGAAYLPSGGLPGNTVFLDLALLATKTSTQVKALIAHEIGHTIGFGHTDDGTGYTAVPGYSGSDGSSIMIQYICGSGNTALSTNDIGSVNVLYRNPFPSNPWIDLSYNSFTIRWDPAPPIYNDTFLHYLIEYGGQSGTGFNSSVQITSSGSNSYVIPGAYPEPDPNTETGYVHATVKAVYSSATCALSTVSKYKSGGVWY